MDDSDDTKIDFSKSYTREEFITLLQSIKDRIPASEVSRITTVDLVLAWVETHSAKTIFAWSHGPNGAVYPVAKTVHYVISHNFSVN